MFLGHSLTAVGGHFCSVLPTCLLAPIWRRGVAALIGKPKTFHFLHQGWESFKVKIHNSSEIVSSLLFLFDVAGFKASLTSVAALCLGLVPDRLCCGEILPRIRCEWGRGQCGKRSCLAKTTEPLSEISLWGHRSLTPWWLKWDFIFHEAVLPFIDLPWEMCGQKEEGGMTDRLGAFFYFWI